MKTFWLNRNSLIIAITPLSVFSFVFILGVEMEQLASIQGSLIPLFYQGQVLLLSGMLLFLFLMAWKTQISLLKNILYYGVPIILLLIGMIIWQHKYEMFQLLWLQNILVLISIQAVIMSLLVEAYKKETTSFL